MANLNKKQTQILNLSSKPLKKEAESLLKKGLTFVPDKKKENISQLINDFTTWGRRMKLKVHFGE